MYAPYIIIALVVFLIIPIIIYVTSSQFAFVVIYFALLILLINIALATQHFFGKTFDIVAAFDLLLYWQNRQIQRSRDIPL